MAAGKQKTHDRFQPWVFVEIMVLCSTSPHGVAGNDDRQQNYDLSGNIEHRAESSEADMGGQAWIFEGFWAV